MVHLSAVMIGLLQGNMVSGKPPTSRSWWRLTASLFAIVGATIGFGYYLPLRQANQLLQLEFEKARRSETSLSQQLGKANAELATVTEERDALRDAKSRSDKTTEDARTRVSHLVEGMLQPLRAAVQAGKARITQQANSLLLDVVEPTWVTASGDALTRTGHRLLCPAVTPAVTQQHTTIVVRSFLASEPSTAESRWAAPGRLAGGVAETLIERCKLNPSAVTIETKAGAAGAPLLQLELTLPNP